MTRFIAAAFAFACTACTGIELDPNNFTCNAGGPCLPDASSARADAGAEDEDAATEAPDDAAITRDATTGQDAVSDAGTNGRDAAPNPDAAAPDTGVPCSAGPSGTWQRLAPANAIARSGHSAILDEAQSRALIFGGAGNDNSTAVLNLSGTPAFQDLPTTGDLPAGRREHSAIYDPMYNTMVVLAGLDASNDLLGNTFVLDLADNSWGGTGFYFTGRASSAAIYDGEQPRYFGGCSGSTAQDQEWVFDNFTRSWSPWVRITDSPPSRCDAAVTAFGTSMLIHGGRDGSTTLDDMWMLPSGVGEDWIELARGPGSRSGHSAAHDRDRNRALFFGGVSAGGQQLDELWALAITSPEDVCWARLTPGGSERPSARSQHTAFVFNGKMYLYGGTDGANALSELWELSF